MDLHTCTQNLDQKSHIETGQKYSIKTYKNTTPSQLSRSNVILDMNAQIKKIIDDPLYNSSKLRYASQLNKLKDKTKGVKDLERQLSSYFAQLGIKIAINKNIDNQLPELKSINSVGNEFIKTSTTLIEHYEQIMQRILDREESSQKTAHEVIFHLNGRVNELTSEIDKLKKEVDNKTDKTSLLHVHNDQLSQSREIHKFQSVIMMKERCIQNLKEKSKKKNKHLRYLWLNQKYRMKEAYEVINRLDKNLSLKDSTIKNISKVLENSDTPNSAMDSIKEIIINNKKDQHIESHLESSQTTNGQKQLNNSFLRSMREFKTMLDVRHKVVFENQSFIVELEKEIKTQEKLYEEKAFDLKTYKNAQNTTSIKPSINDMIEEQEKEIEVISNKISNLRNRKGDLERSIAKLKDELRLIYKTNKQKFRNLDYQIRQALYDYNSYLKTNKEKYLHIMKNREYNNVIDKRIKIVLKKYKELQNIEDFLFKYDLIQHKPMIKAPDTLCKTRDNENIVDIAAKQKTNNVLLTDIEKTVEQQLINLTDVMDKKESSLCKVGYFIEDLRKLNDILKKDFVECQKLAIIRSSSDDKLKQLQEGLQRCTDEIKNIEESQPSEIDTLNRYSLLPSDVNNIQSTELQTDKSAAKYNIQKIEKIMQRKATSLEETLSKIITIEQSNMDLKEQLEEQFKKMKNIYSDSIQRYDLLQDLLKKDKIFDQLYNYQAEKINVKDKRISMLESKIKDYEDQIKKLNYKSKDNDKLDDEYKEDNKNNQISKSEKNHMNETDYKSESQTKNIGEGNKIIISDAVQNKKSKKMLLQHIEYLDGVIKEQEKVIKNLKTEQTLTGFRKCKTVEIGEENDLETVLKKFDTFNNENDYMAKKADFPQSLRFLNNNVPKTSDKMNTDENIIMKQHNSVSKVFTLLNKLTSLNDSLNNRLDKLVLKFERLSFSFPKFLKGQKKVNNAIYIFQKVLQCDYIDINSQNLEHQLTQHLKKIINSNKKEEHDNKYQDITSLNMTLETDFDNYRTIINRLISILNEHNLKIETDEDNEIVLEKLQRFMHQKTKLSKDLEIKIKLIKELKDQISEYLEEIDDKSKEIEILEETLNKNRQELNTNKKKHLAEKKEQNRILDHLRKENDRQNDQISTLTTSLEERNAYINSLQTTISKMKAPEEKDVLSFRNPKYKNEVSMDNLKTKEQVLYPFAYEKSISIESSKEIFGSKTDNVVLGDSNSKEFIEMKKDLNNVKELSQIKRNFKKRQSDDSTPVNTEDLKLLNEERNKEKNIFDESSANLDSILGGKKNVDSFQLNSEQSLGNIDNTNRSMSSKVKENDSDIFEELLKPKIIELEDEPTIQKPVKDTEPISFNDIKFFNFKKS